MVQSDGTEARRLSRLVVTATLFALPLAFLVAIPVAGAARTAERATPSTCPPWVASSTSVGTTTPTTTTTPQPTTTTVPVATTMIPAASAPTITVGSTTVGASSAAVTAATTGMTGSEQVTIQYWITHSAPVCATVQRALKLPLGIVLSGLRPSIRYRFEVFAKTAAGTVVSKAGTFVTLPAGTIAEGVTVGDTSVGRLDHAAALTALNRSVGKPLHLGYSGAVWHVLPSSLGVHVNVAQTVATALQATPGQKLPGLSVSIDAQSLQRYVSSLSHRWGHKANQDSIRLVGTHAVVTPAGPGVTVDTALLTQQIRTELLQGARALLKLPVKRTAVSIATPQKVVVVRRSSQTLTAYLNGKPVLTTPVTTGRPALPTPIGSYSVLNRESPYVFHSPWALGSPYYYPPTPVTWAMEFYDGDFLHDDPGEPADAFGSDSQNGYFASHGCVHVPHSVMAFLYNWLPVGAPVIIADT